MSVVPSRFITFLLSALFPPTPRQSTAFVHFTPFMSSDYCAVLAEYMYKSVVNHLCDPAHTSFPAMY